MIMINFFYRRVAVGFPSETIRIDHEDAFT